MKTSFAILAFGASCFALSLPCLAQDAQLNIYPAVELVWSTQTGSVYQVYGSPDLHAWHPVGPAVQGNGTTNTLFVRAVDSARYFRLSTTNPLATLLVHEGFEGSGSGGFSTFWTPSESYYRAEIYNQRPGFLPFPTAPVHSGTHSGRYLVLQGTDETQPFNVGKYWPTPIEEIYFEWHEFFESNYPFASGQKLARIHSWDGPANRARGAAVFVEYNWDGLPISALLFFTLDANTLMERIFTKAFTMPTNQWVKFGVYLKLNTPGHTNGVAQVFVNDMLFAGSNAVAMRSDNNGFNYLWIGGNNSWGSGVNGYTSAPRDGSRFIDDIRIYSTKPF